MRHVVRMVGVGVLAAGFSLAVGVVLVLPAAAGVAVTVRGGQAGVGSVAAWPGRVSSVLAGRLDLILRLTRCPLITNGSDWVPLVRRS